MGKRREVVGYNYLFDFTTHFTTYLVDVGNPLFIAWVTCMFGFGKRNVVLEKPTRVGVKLLDNVEKLKLVMDLAKIVQWEYDIDRDEFFFNDALYVCYGTTATREGGYYMTSAAYVEKFVFAEDRRLVSEEIMKAISTTDPHFVNQLDHRIVRGDGGVRIITVRYALIKDEKGKTVKLYGANQDITDQRLLNNAFSQQKSLLSDVVETIPDFIFWKDRKCVYLGCNLNFALAAGLNNPKEIVGKNDMELAWTKENAEKYRIDDVAVMESGQAKLNFVETQRQADDKEITITMSKVP